MILVNDMGIGPVRLLLLSRLSLQQKLRPHYHLPIPEFNQTSLFSVLKDKANFFYFYSNVQQVITFSQKRI